MVVSQLLSVTSSVSYVYLSSVSSVEVLHCLRMRVAQEVTFLHMHACMSAWMGKEKEGFLLFYCKSVGAEREKRLLPYGLWAMAGA